MKRKICVALLTLSSGLMMVFAVEVDKCVEKFEECKVVCGNDKARCMARGNQVESCNARLNECNADCNKKVKECQAKNPSSAKPSPKPAAPKPSPKK